MTAFLLALAAAAGVLLLLALVWLLARARARQEDVTEVLAALDARLDGLLAEVTDALEENRRERRREWALADVRGSVDLDEVLARTLDAAAATPDVECALVSVDIPGGEPVIASLGLPVTGSLRLDGPPDGSAPRAMTMRFLPGERLEERSGVRSGVVVPVAADGNRLGHLAVYTRSDRPLGEAVVDALEDLADRAAPAIAHALHFLEERRLAGQDSLTGLYNRSFFHEALGREAARAHRYEQDLALVVLKLRELAASEHQASADSALAEAAGRIRELLRPADVASRVAGDEIAIALPRTTPDDAEDLLARVDAALRRPPLDGIAVSAGIAELRAEDDAISLFVRAEQDLSREESREPAPSDTPPAAGAGHASDGGAPAPLAPGRRVDEGTGRRALP